MFIRLTDNTAFRTNENDSFVPRKRKGNVVKKFNLKGKDFKYYNEEVDFKLIPKAQRQFVERGILKILVTKTKNLMFQDFKGEDYSVKFLEYNENSDTISKASFDELSRGSSILVFDRDTDDWSIEEVDDLIMVDMAEYSSTYNKTQDEKGEDSLSKLSNYIMNTDKGILINDIFVT